MIPFLFHPRESALNMSDASRLLQEGIAVPRQAKDFHPTTLKSEKFISERLIKTQTLKVERKMRGVWRVSAVLTALVLVVSGVAMFGYSGTMWKNGIGEGGEKGVIPLMPPPFIQIAGASDIKGGSVFFPEKDAGISAYVNVGEDVIDTEDIKKLLESDLFEQPVENFSANHIIGIVPVPNYGGTVRPHVYVDTEGWIVAYFTKDEPASKIMQWSGTDTNNPRITEIKTTTLEDAIEKLCNETGIDYVEVKPKIKYYDFEFPDANGMLLFVKTRATGGSNYTYVMIPSDYTLYEASYSHYACNYYGDCDHDEYRSYLKVDGTTVNKIEHWDAWGCDPDMDIVYKQYDIDSVFTVGTPHTVEITYSHDMVDDGSAGVATVLIYKTA